MYYTVGLGKNIVSLRKVRGLSREKLVELAKISVTWMRHIEHNRANVTWDIVEYLANALDVPVWVLFALQAGPDAIGDELHEIQALLRPAKEAVLV